MSRLLKRRLAVATILVALLAGGTAVALGATGTGEPRSALSQLRHRKAGKRASILAISARYLGISPAQLRLQLQAGKSLAEVAEASSGRSTSGLVAALVAARTAHLSEHLTALVGRPGAGDGAPGAGLSPARAAALSYLGLSRKELRSKIRGGSSLAQIAAGTPGKSAAGLVDAITTSIAKRLDGPVEAGGLSKGVRLARIRERVTAAVQREPAPAPR